MTKPRPLHAQRPAGRDRARARRVAARRAARALRRHLDQGRLPAPGAVRLLPGPDRRPPARHLRVRGAAGRGPRGADPRGRRPARARDRLEGARRGRGRAVRLLHPRDRAPRQAPPRPAARPEPRRDRAGDRRPPLPLHRLHADRRGGRADGAGLARRRAAGAGRTTAASASRSPATAPWARLSASGPTWPTCSARACCTAPSSSPPHARARVVRIDTSKAAALPGVRAVVTAADVPGERWYGLLYDDWPGFVAEGEEVRCVGDVLAAVAADDARTAREAAALVEVEYEPLPPVLDPEAALRPRRAPGQPEAPEPPLALGHPPGRRGGGPRRERARRQPAPGTPSGSSTSSSSPRPPSRSPCRTDGSALYTPGPGRLRRPAAGRALPRRAGGAGPRGARAERRGLRRQGGHVGPGADGAPRARHRPAGQARPDSRGVRPAAPEAPPHPARLHGGLRRRGQAHRGRGAARRRLGRLRLGRRQGPRARRRPRLRPVPGAAPWTWRRSPPTRTTRPAGPCAGSASRRRPSPSRAASTSWRRRSASTAGRSAAATRWESATR